MKYTLVENLNKVFSEATLATTMAVDPNHWNTDIDNLKDKVASLQTEIDDILKVQIPAKEAERDDFLSQFPQFKV